MSGTTSNINSFQLMDQALNSLQAPKPIDKSNEGKLDTNHPKLIHRFSEDLGLKRLHASPGQVGSSLKTKDDGSHNNGWETIHGGVRLAAADGAIGATALSKELDSNNVALLTKHAHEMREVVLPGEEIKFNSQIIGESGRERYISTEIRRAFNDVLVGKAMSTYVIVPKSKLEDKKRLLAEELCTPA